MMLAVSSCERPQVRSQDERVDAPTNVPEAEANWEFWGWWCGRGR